MNLHKKIILIALYTINFANLFSGLLPDTMVFVAKGAYKKAKDLEVGDRLPIYKIPEHQLDVQKRKIVEIKTRKTKELIYIEANGNKIIVGENQKLYNRRINAFIPAKDFNIGDMLFSPEMGNLPIPNIAKIILETEIDLYDISMEDGCIFLILSDKNSHIIVHDKTIHTDIFDNNVISLLIESAISIVTATGIIIICEKLLSNKKETVDSKQNKTDKINSLDTTTSTTNTDDYAKIYENYIKRKKISK